MVKPIFRIYRLAYAVNLAAALQHGRYYVRPYLRFVWGQAGNGHMAAPRPRGPVAWTLAVLLAGGMALQLATGLALLMLWWWQNLPAGWQLGLALLVSYPYVWPHLILVPVILGRLVVVWPAGRLRSRLAAALYRRHEGYKVLIVGADHALVAKAAFAAAFDIHDDRAGADKAATDSKVSPVVVTPSGADTVPAIENLARRLHGRMVAVAALYTPVTGTTLRAVRLMTPDMVVVTDPDILEAELPAVLAAAKPKTVYVYDNGSKAAGMVGARRYRERSVMGWRLENLSTGPGGTSFELARRKRRIRMETPLLGPATVLAAALAAAAALKAGVPQARVLQAMAVAQTIPRASPLRLYDVNSATVIDATAAAGLAMVADGARVWQEWPAARRWCLAAGLEHAGVRDAEAHHELGRLIAGARPQQVILAANTVQPYIAAGLAEGGYEGQLHVEADLMAFAADLRYHIAAGDVVLLQGMAGLAVGQPPQVPAHQTASFVTDATLGS